MDIYVVSAKHYSFSLELRAFLCKSDADDFLLECFEWEKVRESTHAAVKREVGQSHLDAYRAWYASCPFGANALRTGYSADILAIDIKSCEFDLDTEVEVCAINANSQALDNLALNSTAW